jgi:hypothetical protein
MKGCIPVAAGGLQHRQPLPEEHCLRAARRPCVCSHMSSEDSAPRSPSLSRSWLPRGLAASDPFHHLFVRVVSVCCRGWGRNFQGSSLHYILHPVGPQVRVQCWRIGHFCTHCAQVVVSQQVSQLFLLTCCIFVAQVLHMHFKLNPCNRSRMVDPQGVLLQPISIWQCSTAKLRIGDRVFVTVCICGSYSRTASMKVPATA